MPVDLRDVVEEDVQRLFAWRNEPEVDRWMYGAPPTRAQHDDWFEAFLIDPDRKGWIILRDEQPCGSLTLTGLTTKQRRAQWGWYIGDADARGRGAGRAVQALGLERAFNEFGQQKIWAEVLAGNDVALRAQASAGFRREGYLRRHAFKHGEYRDVVLLGILKEEWQAQREKVLANLTLSGMISKPAKS